jgi:hypothetical protein
MPKSILTERVADLRGFSAVKAAGAKLPLWPQHLAHVYVKLDFKPESENAASAEAARGFLRSVARAAVMAHNVAQLHDGFLLEVQGSMLHIGLVGNPGQLLDSTYTFASDLHIAYRQMFSDPQKRVQGWRMSVDAGKTLVVVGRGVHGDDSYVSLSNAANRPAKHLYSQLAIPLEADRALKRFCIAVRDSGVGRWLHIDLDSLAVRQDYAVIEGRIKQAQKSGPKVLYEQLWPRGKLVTARALPVAPPGTRSAPSPEQPYTHFGWVMRADLDGFTKRVEECFDDDWCLSELGRRFYHIMDLAAVFVQRHEETLAQLPWSGDNFTAAAIYDNRQDYEQAVPKRVVELTLDFEKELKDIALSCGFGGWAYGVAGGEPCGNAGGNVYLAGIEVDQRRFLVGVGEGFGRSIEAFGDINPKPQEAVVYEPDWRKMHTPYKAAHEPAVNTAGQTSSLFRIAKTEQLLKIRAKDATQNSAFTIKFPREQPKQVLTRPHF